MWIIRAGSTASGGDSLELHAPTFRKSPYRYQTFFHATLRQQVPVLTR
jgi:hypothetical protein